MRAAGPRLIVSGYAALHNLSKNMLRCTIYPQLQTIVAVGFFTPRCALLRGLFSVVMERGLAAFPGNRKPGCAISMKSSHMSSLRRLQFQLV
jgi:hypothetical protein